MQMRETTVCQLEDDDYADVLTHDTDVDVFNMAIEALEKQIPKKKVLEWICPRCGARIGRMDYCKYCGQKLKD